mgnify:FL=1
MNDTVALIQGSEEWKQARCGSLGASRVADAMARTKTGWGASRANLMAELLVERLTGRPTEGYVSAAMQWGIDTEPDAITEYEFRKGVEVVRVGLIRHPRIPLTHASPDAFVGAEGLIQVKCPQTATHLDYLISETLPGNYRTQVMWELACTGRRWCDFWSFDPRLPEKLKVFCTRIERDDVYIAQLEEAVAIFLLELESKILQLEKKYGDIAVAA